MLKYVAGLSVMIVTASALITLTLVYSSPWPSLMVLAVLVAVGVAVAFISDKEIS